MKEQNLKSTDERLKYAISLRESTGLIKCRAIVEYPDDTNWQWVHADILPKAINSEGYVEEVWIAPDSVRIHEQDVNGEVYSILSANLLQYINKVEIGGFIVTEGEPRLLPSSNLIVRYRIPE